MDNKRIVRLVWLFSLLVYTPNLLFSGNESRQQQGTKESRDVNGKSRPPERVKHSDILFDRPVYNFGEREWNEEVKHTFIFENVGEGALKIYEVKADCACTATLLSEDTIEPAGTGEIEMKFSTGNKVGHISHRIRVRSNDPDEAITELRVTGRVTSDFVWKPKRIYMGDVSEAKSITRKVRLEEVKQVGLEVEKVECDSILTSTDISKSSTEQGKRIFTIVLHFDVSKAQGIIYEKLKIHTNSKTLPFVVIPVSGSSEKGIRVSPKRLFFGFVKNKAKVQRTVKIERLDGKKFKILKIETSVAGIRLQCDVSKSKSSYTLAAELDPAAASSKVTGLVKVFVDDDTTPIIDLPVFGIIPKRE